MTDPLIYGMLSSIFVMVTYGILIGLKHLDNISHNVEVIARALTEENK